MATIFTVDAHAGGEPCRVVTGGVPPLRGETIAERRACFRSEHDWMRTALMHEPRGHDGMFGALLLSPERATSAFGLVFFDPVGYIDGCGHATLCASAVWHRMMGSGETPPLSVDNPDGSVTKIVAARGGGDACSTVLEMPPTEVLRPEVPVSGLPADAVGLARCGNVYLAVRAEAVGVSDLPTASGATVREEATRVREMAAPSLEQEPGLPGRAVSRWLEVVLYQRRPDAASPSPDACTTASESGGGRAAEGAPALSTAVLFSGTQIDRSPCGTGSCALFGLLSDRGELSPDEGLTTVGPMGGKFHLTAAGPEDGSGGPRGRRFHLEGTAHLTGVHQWILGEGDRLGAGYRYE